MKELTADEIAAAEKAAQEPQHGFTDPVLRCDSCQALLKLETLHKHGACIKCGNRRVRNLTVFNEAEKKQMEEWGFHEFLAEFGEVDE